MTKTISKDLSKLHSIVDGVEEIPATDFQSFPLKIGKSKYVHIPTSIDQKLKLKKHDFVEVAVRKVTERYVAENYLSESFMPFWRAQAKRYCCPNCGKPGRIDVKKHGRKTLKSFSVYVRHCQVDGFPFLTSHRIIRRDHPKIWMRYVKSRYPNSFPENNGYDNW